MDETRPTGKPRDIAAGAGRHGAATTKAPRRPPPARPAVGRPVLEIRLGDVLRLRKRHPCGGHEWLVDRLGADIGIRCLGCRRHVLVDRRALEGRIVAFVSRGDEAMSDAVRPRARDEAGRAGAESAALSTAPSGPGHAAEATEIDG